MSLQCLASFHLGSPPCEQQTRVQRSSVRSERRRARAASGTIINNEISFRNRFFTLWLFRLNLSQTVSNVEKLCLVFSERWLSWATAVTRTEIKIMIRAESRGDKDQTKFFSSCNTRNRIIEHFASFISLRSLQMNPFDLFSKFAAIYRPFV